MSYRVLIIDNDRDSCHTLKGQCEAVGYDATTCANGPWALALIRLQATRSPFDVVLIDLDLPGMDGMTVLHELRYLDGAPPAIIMSATARQEVFWEAIGAGASECLRKPIDPEELLTKCHRTLRDSGQVQARAVSVPNRREFHAR